MKTLNKFSYLFILLLLFVGLTGCDSLRSDQTVESASGVKLATVQVKPDANGNTVEQRNIAERLLRDNKPGSIKYLYIISPFTGDIVFQSTVKGKVTSSSKRLIPSDLVSNWSSVNGTYPERMTINGKTYYSYQLPGDDGTYGSSVEYLYWFDTNDVYHQHYRGGGEIHISDQPMSFRKTTQNVDTDK
jgi:hypothetical protein